MKKTTAKKQQDQFEKAFFPPMGSKPPVVKLVNYTMSAIIRTGDYSDIRPTIVVEAETLATAQAYVLPFINDLFTEYLGRDTRRIKEIKKPEEIIKALNENKVTPEQIMNTNGAPEVKMKFVNGIPVTTPYDKALQAVKSCMSTEALALITKQIEASVKLTKGEKESLAKPVADKLGELLNQGK